MRKTITIFTPTYNRAYILPRLYRSLKEQSCKDFIWLIVDDGSNDNTETIIKEWMKEDIIEINYIKQENQGKHIAHNSGVENCNTELFFCVDSDDFLFNNAIENILNEYETIKNDDSICGIVSIRVNEENQPIAGVDMPNNIDYSSLSELYEKHGLKGDTALVFKTYVLNKYKFPKIEGEKFIGEEYIFCQIDSRYKLFVSNNKYYKCKYLEDGYTQNMIKTIKSNPRGYMLLKQKKLENSLDSSFFVKYKQASLYTVGCWLSKENFLKNSPSKFYSIISVPLAVAVYIIRFF